MPPFCRQPLLSTLLFPIFLYTLLSYLMAPQSNGFPPQIFTSPVHSHKFSVLFCHHKHNSTNSPSPYVIGASLQTLFMTLGTGWQLLIFFLYKRCNINLHFSGR
ncbi:hypothetical protein FKM82_008823 [Ascaphus truei]